MKVPLVATGAGGVWRRVVERTGLQGASVPVPTDLTQSTGHQRSVRTSKR